jgi:transcriptional regulator with XRE-family HTH domain
MATATTMGQRIKQARLAKGLTQTELAKKIGASSHSIICDYETGKRGKKRPDIAMLVKLSAILDISIDWLFLGKKDSS